MASSTVLLVEDNDINRDMLTRRLTRAGLTVMTATDGASALDAMREHQPGVVLMDMTLPVLSGWEATEKAKSDPSVAAIPIIALTAHAMAADRERAMKAGCSDYETKPIDFPALLSKIYLFLGANNT
ncbi:MAG: response regulator [Alteromonadaceae bacterium TMED101]|nr:MAG: response regulator [Alteromonadaceae bacterium TMED101]|tara:strand:+ start:1969 stop:2349 length:381 start_codon:yes stop_codon:yes gene_type:complete